MSPRQPSAAPEGPDSDRASKRLRVVEHEDSDAKTPNGEYNLRILQPIFGYVRDKLGEEFLREIVHGCGLPPSTLERKSAWISHQQIEHLLAAIREQVDSDEEFIRACAYEFKKQYGPLLLVMRCLSVRGLMELAARTGHMACRVGHYEVMDGTRTSVRVRFHTDRPESRLICLSRQAAGITMPTLFMGMGPAKLRESSCVAHGDAFCEYHLTWNEPLRLRWVFMGLAMSTIAALLLPESLIHPYLALAILPPLGALAGSAAEMRRILAEHVDFTAKAALDTEKVVHAHAEGMDALTDLQYRERDWNRRVEEGVALRTEKLNLVVHRLQSVLQRRTGSFRAIDNDAITTLSHLADDLGTDDDGDDESQISAMETAVEKVSRLVGELVDIAREDPTKQPLTPETIGVDELVVRIRRQLKATMMGRDVRVTVFQTREAPQSITSVRSMIERILDNLLFNASRHTERGSIVVEIGGTPGSLLLKLSDTGQGVSKQRLEQVFGHGSHSLANQGSGLSSAARLLDSLGGRLEIMSEPDVGTTLWVYIPIDMSAASSASEADTPGRSTRRGPPPSSGSVLSIRAQGDPDPER